jgi:integrase
MPTTFPFSEERIRKLKPPADRDREYHKDKTYPGLQVCVTSAGSKTFYLVKRTDGRPTRHLLGNAAELSVDQARKAAAAKAGKIASGENPQADRRRKREEPTLEKLHKHWMLYATAHKKPSSAAEDKRVFEKLCSGLAKRRLGTIKKADVQALHATIGTDNGIYAANRTLALLRAMFNVAEEIGYRGDNPAKGVKTFKEESRDRFLQIGELEAFFTALDSEAEVFRHFFLTLLLTGARKSNVLSMKWADVDLAAGYWRIAENKSGSVVVVPLVAPAVAILAARKETTNGCPWVFPGRRDDHLKEPDKAWSRIVARAGLADLRIHDLRRSLGSWMAGQNVSLTIIGKVLGHKSPQATAVYARLAMDPQRQAMDAATTAMLTAGKQTKLLTIDVQAQEDGNNGKA